MIGVKPLRILFDKANGFIIGYGETKYLVSIGSQNYDAIFERIRYFLGLKIGISCIASDNYEKIKIGSNDDLPLEKT